MKQKRLSLKEQEFSFVETTTPWLSIIACLLYLAFAVVGIYKGIKIGIPIYNVLLIGFLFIVCFIPMIDIMHEDIKEIKNR